jgi:predicted ribosomally synthesized peptide with SipW-like signal peptide
MRLPRFVRGTQGRGGSAAATEIDNHMTPLTSQTQPARRRRRRPLLLLLGLLGVVGIGAGQLSLALFTDTETVDGVFSSGSIILDAARIDALTLSTGAMMPGDSVTDDVVVENDGTAQLRYAISTSSTNADGLNLRDVLTLEVRTIDGTTPGTPCDDFDGTSLLAATALGPSAAGVGDPAAGADSGDRTLNASASEVLCFQVQLPTSAANSLQSLSATATFTFSAEQTANNP